MTPVINKIDFGTVNPLLARTALVSLVGGTTSVIGGGKFGEGAVTAAFGYLFNCMQHEACYKSYAPAVSSGVSVDKNIQDVLSGKVGFWNWIDRVRTGGEWDYKNLYDNRYRNAGNFNFGATCGAMGIGYEGCLRGAGVYQVYSGTSNPITMGTPFDNLGLTPPLIFTFRPGSCYGDDCRDQFWIRRGLDYFNSQKH